MHSNISIARKLRRNQTEAEKLLWYYLRRKNLGGLKFRRQVPIGPYITDFACLEKRVIIELDGGQHNLNHADSLRDLWFQNEGYQVLRFWNHEVFQETKVILEKIHNVCMNHPPPNPLPSREWESK